MDGTFPLRPVWHGSVGVWDEVLSLIPIVVGALLLLYMFISARRRDERDVKTDPPPDRAE